MKATPKSLDIIVQMSHAEEITSLAISPDDKYLLSGSAGDSAVKLWEIERGVLIRNFVGHTGWIRSVAFSPDGKYILTGSWDWSAKLWDVRTGECKKTYYGILVHDACFVGNDHIATVGFQQISATERKFDVWLWELFGDTCLHQFEGHKEEILSVDGSEDGKYIISGSRDKTAILWDVEQKALIHTYSHDHLVHAVSFGKEESSHLFGTGTAQETFNEGKDAPRKAHVVRIWNINGDRQTPQNTLNGHEDNIYSIEISSNGKYAISGGAGHEVCIWDIKDRDTNQPIYKHNTHGVAVMAVGFSHDSRYWITGDHDKTPRLWDISTRDNIRTFDGHAAIVYSAAMDARGKYLIEGSEGNDINVWDLHKGELVDSLNKKRAKEVPWGSILSLDFSSDGIQLLTGSTDGSLVLWDIEKKAEIKSYDAKGPISSVSLSEDGEYMGVGCVNGEVLFWRPNKDEPEEIKEYQANWGSYVDIHAGKGYMAMAFDHYDNVLTDDKKNQQKPDRTDLIIWDYKNKRKYQVPYHRDRIRAIKFSSDGHFLATACHDGKARLWDLRNIENIVCLKEFHEGNWVISVDVSADGKYLLTGNRDNRARLWDIESGAQLHTFTGHKSEVYVSFDPRGKYIITASKDSTTKIWNQKSGEEIATLTSIGEEDWAVLTPQGLFDASPGAMRRMHYVSEMEIIELDQLKERYYEPGLLAKILSDEETEIREVDDLTDAPLFPALEKFEIDQAEHTLSINIREREGGMGKISLFINHKEVEENINEDKRTELTLDLTKYNDYFTPGMDSNIIGIRLYNEEGWLKSPAHELTYTAKLSSSRGWGDIDHKKFLKDNVPDPALYAILIGTSNYKGRNEKGKSLALTYPDHDAESLSKAIKAVGKELFKDRIDVQLLTTHKDKGPSISSKENITQAFEKVAKKAGPQDIVFVYFSGHGMNYGVGDKAQFYYLTKEFKLANLRASGTKKKNALSSEELTALLNKIPAKKQVLVFDACHSGKAIEGLTAGKKALDSTQERALERMKDRTGMFVLAGSAADKVSFEATRFGQGLLTYSILMGMKGAAVKSDDTAKPTVDIMTLFQFSRDRVPALAEEIAEVQEPIIASPLHASSFDIGISDERSQKQIPLKPPKPIFVRSVFMDGDKFIDHLALGEALDNRFIEAARKKDKMGNLIPTPFIFINTHKLTNSWTIRGIYTSLKGGKHNLKAKLFEGTKVKKSIEISGKSALDLAKKLEVEALQSIKK